MTPEVAVMVLQSQTETPPSLALVQEAITALAGLVDQHVPERVDLPDDQGYPACWHFVGFWPEAAAFGKHTPDQLNPPNAPQYQGVVFADGTVVMRWLTARRSWSVWDDFAEMFDVHGHPEYGTRIVWPSGDAPQEALDVINAAMDALAAKRAAEAEEPATVGGAPLEERGQADPRPERRTWRESGYRSATDPDGQPAAPDDHPPSHQTYSTTEPPNDNTLVVCLDCDGPPAEGGGTLPLIVPFTERRDADSWLRVHLDSNPDHRAVTVRGWPPPGRAIAIARHHGRELRAGGPTC